MVQDIYDPLTEYVNVFRNRFRDVAHSTFAELAKEAQVDVEANRETCRQLYSLEENVASVRKLVVRWNLLHVLLWIVVAGCVIAGVLVFQKPASQSVLWDFVLIGVLLATALYVLFRIVTPKLNELKDEQNGLEVEVDRLRTEAWKQMEPLNRLYDWDVLTRMMTRTVPRLEFDPYFTTQRLADLKMVYGWDDSFNAERSVVYSHSGLINGNPFVICRTKKMEMGPKTYYGEKTIYWTTRERGSDGKYHSVDTVRR